MGEDNKSAFVLLLGVLVVVGGLFLLGSAFGFGPDWAEWYLGWLLYPLYIFVPAGLLWVLFIGLGVVQDRVEEAQERLRKRKTQRRLQGQWEAAQERRRREKTQQQDHTPVAKDNLEPSKPMGGSRVAKSLRDTDKKPEHRPKPQEKPLRSSSPDPTSVKSMKWRLPSDYHLKRAVEETSVSTYLRDPRISTDLYVAALQRDYEHCKRCHRSRRTHPQLQWEVVHIVPESKGGRTVLDNLQTLCTECNSNIAKKVKIPAGLRAEVLNRDNFTCQWCGRSREKDKVVLHVDHKEPESKGGKTELENLQVLCEECNLGKGDKYSV